MQGSGIRVGDILRDGRPKSATPAVQAGYRNVYAVTAIPGRGFVPLESGINPMAAVAAVDGPRIPAILIASSPHKIGKLETPWQDHFEPDNGYIRYYGDNRHAGQEPALKRGNASLLRALDAYTHHAKATRSTAVPLIFFRRVPRDGKRKGFLQFEGFGIVTAAERVAQYSKTAGGSFSNYAFDLLVMSMIAENEVFDWDWIRRRAEADKSTAECLDAAPEAWQRWVHGGSGAIDRVRRRVSKLMLESKADQMPVPGSDVAKILTEIYTFYSNKNARFESLAATVAARVIGPSYLNGGLTRATGDGGIDFIGRLDVGSGFHGGHLGPAKILVLGQAKCEKLTSPTSGRHIARTVARLRRGWIGAYVTTSFFSEATQREVIEDRYPIVLINGRRLAEEVQRMQVEAGGGTQVKSFLETFNAENLLSVEIRDPEELLTR